MPEQSARMAKHLILKLNRIACALGAMFLVIAQVQALSHDHAHSRGTHHRRSSWDKLASVMQQFQDQAGAAGSRRIPRRISVYSNYNLFSQSQSERSPVETTMPPSRRAVVTMRSARQEMDALMSFRANISKSGMTFQNWDAHDSTPCGWTGVSCLRGEKHVVKLNLPSRRLVGNINSALLALSELPLLQQLDLSDNNFTSFISGLSLLNFSRLALLNLSYNQVSGDIPVEVGELSGIQWLSLAGNSLSGPIPLSITNCSMLKTLDLDSNLLVSHIPEEIGRLTHLEELVLGTSLPPGVFLSPPLARNKLLGPIPSSLGNCSLLRTLRLTNNPTLQGKIPLELGQLRSIRVLDFFNCNLEGVFPQWIGNLTNLLIISLGYNHVHGSLPAELGRLSNLLGLLLPNNFIVGSIPSEIGNCTSLTDLDVGDNLIGGVIPSSLRECNLLTFLSFAKNPFVDPQVFPQWITSLINLEFLILLDINLHGKIPDDIGRLSKLHQTSLEDNQLTGSIPSSIVNCSLLQVLTLSSNNLTGRIPSKIGLLSNFIAFDAQHNDLTGSIPTSITNLTQLVYLLLGFNALGGIMEGDWGLLLQLQYFGVNDNQFVGSIPRTLSYCSNLVFLSLDQNQLTGEIPAAFGNLSQLERFSIVHNRIGGTVPANLGNCSFLSLLAFSNNRLKGLFPHFSGVPWTILYLDENNFTGAILESLKNLTHLVELDLSLNQFSGIVLGETVSTWTSLTYINLSHNLLSGSLSDDWSVLLNMKEVDVSNNMISGWIPSLSKLKGLYSLDLSRNNFSGELPQDLASLPALAFFNASYNNFAGPIPSSRAFDSNFTTSSFLGNPGLCGGVLGPSRACPHNASKSQSGGHCNQFGCAKVWIPMLVTAITCVFLTAAVVICCCWTGCWMRSKGARESTRKHDVYETANIFHKKVPRLAPSDILAVIGDERNKIGRGSSSFVYKGSLQGWGVVAIKTFVGHEGMNSMPSNVRLWRNLLQREAKLQASLHHQNILKVLSFYANLEFQALVLEYMPRGSLENHLYPSTSTPHMHLLEGDGESGDSGQSCDMPWNIRLGVAIDVAKGMKHLHHDCQEPLIHRDLKPSNILLDNNMVAKIADFGISKIANLCQEGECGKASTSKICGTAGYMPPEYAFVANVSTKGDVFSYGILLLEILSRTSPKHGPPDVDYRSWNFQRFHGNPLGLLDPNLQQEERTDAIKRRQMLLLAKVAFFCTRENPQSRPTMKDVLSMLTQIQELGMVEVSRKTMTELLVPEDEEAEASNGANTWENDDPNVTLPSISM